MSCVHASGCHGDGVGLPRLGIRDMLQRAARAAIAAFSAWRRSVRERRDLLAVDARTRRDLCLTHADVMRHVEAPVWPLVAAAARAAWRRA